MKKEKIIIILSIMALTVPFLWSAALAVDSKRGSPPPGMVVITSINILDDAVEIKGDNPFIYTVYKPSDPYRVVVEIPDADIGAFKDVIKSKSSVISEVSPSQVDAPKPAAKIEILLQTPSDVDSRYSNKSLIVRVKQNNPDGQQSAVSPASGGSAGADSQQSAEKSAIRNPQSAIVKQAAPDPAPNPSARAAGQETLSKAEERSTLPKATEITDIGFDRSNGVVKVVIKGNGSMSPSVFTLKDKIVVDIPDVSLKAPVPSTVMTPVKGLRAGKHKDKTRLVVDLKEAIDFDVLSVKNTIVVAFKNPQAVAVTKETEVTGEPAPQTVEKKAPETKVEEREELEEIETLVTGKYVGRKISLDFQDSDIVPIFRLLADISGYNIVVDPGVRGRLTMKLINVPWDQALDIILKTFALGKTVEGNIIRIAPAAVLAKESDEKIKAKEAETKAEPLETRTFSISYADTATIEKAIKDSRILTPRGSISVDKRTSSMVIKDVAAVFPQIENILADLDKATPQVMIEVRIVEVSTQALRDLGIQWGAKISAANTLSSIGGFPTLNTGAFTGNNFLVDFPSGSAGAGSGTGFSFGILSPDRTFGLDLQLAALETLSKSKIISTPRIVTSDNVPAKISQGEDIPYPQATAEGTISAAFKSVALSIEVTPHITPANSITMSVLTTKEDFSSFVNIGLGQAPRTTKIEGKTTVLVQNGETLVIGGVYKKTERVSEAGVPGLMKIPVIGWLFKNKLKTEDVTELIIFITPRILEQPGTL